MHTVIINVSTQYLPDHEASKDGRFVFAYRVSIHNHNDTPIQLMHRKWLVTDGNGKQKKISGEGVVGKQPVIEPGESFSYTSGVLIDTPVGTMQGSYNMQTHEGASFDAKIDVFSLAVPKAIH